MSEMLTVVIVEPLKRPEVRRIRNGLREMQGIVGGYIEAVFPFAESVALICNEEGKAMRLRPNRLIKDTAGNPLDVICGTFFIVGVGEEEFESLSDEQAQRYLEMFKRPQVFGRGIPCAYEIADPE